MIITLPVGANMSATAVVSADRRYVRATTQPLFSTIPVVNTFNYQSGSSGSSQRRPAAVGAGSPEQLLVCCTTAIPGSLGNAVMDECRACRPFPAAGHFS